jgi:hypothetical protein
MYLKNVDRTIGFGDSILAMAGNVDAAAHGWKRLGKNLSLGKVMKLNTILGRRSN